MKSSRKFPGVAAIVAVVLAVVMTTGCSSRNYAAAGEESPIPAPSFQTAPAVSASDAFDYEQFTGDSDSTSQTLDDTLNESTLSI